MLLVGQFGCLEIQLDQVRYFPELQSEQTAGPSVCCSLRDFYLWVGPEVRPDVYLQHTAGAIVDAVYVVIFPSPQGRSHFGVMLVTLWAVCTVPYLWSCFGEASAKSRFSGECRGGCMVLLVSFAMF